MKYVLVSGGVIRDHCLKHGLVASDDGPFDFKHQGTMSPVEHGEVFCAESGAEMDLDIGNYERYLNIILTGEHNITTGKIYQHVISRERKGDYLGKTVQVATHICGAIIEWCERVAKLPVEPGSKRVPDVCIIELGGCVGDLESGPFTEAMRQFRQKVGAGNFLHIFVSLLPVAAGDQKTKPTQQAVRESRSFGLSPDFIACRCAQPLEPATIDKIALFCDVKAEHILAVHDVESTYHVPVLLHDQNLGQLLWNGLCLDTLDITSGHRANGKLIWKQWKTLTSGSDRYSEQVDIALVGKYSNYKESYISVIKSLEHAAMAIRKRVNVVYVDASHLELKASEDSPANYHKAWTKICTAHGILVPGGFGVRGSEGMIAATQWARTKDIPFLGICFGFQLAAVEFARNVCNLPNATSAEFDARASNPVILPMEEIDQEVMGGTMRLGLHPTVLQSGSEWSKLRTLYGRARRIQDGDTNPVVLERHRHRYEVNPKYAPKLTEHGLHFIGKDEKGLRLEIFELRDRTWHVGVQYHPEYVSKVLHPSPVFLGFVAASAGCLDTIEM